MFCFQLSIFKKIFSIKELNDFRYETCKVILSEKISKLNHKAGFGDQIFRPLLYACYGNKGNSKTFAYAKKAVKQIQQELLSDNITEFIQTASCFPPVEINPEDVRLKNILEFANAIKEYTAYLNELFVLEQDQLELNKIANIITQKYYPKYDLIKEL